MSCFKVSGQGATYHLLLFLPALPPLVHSHTCWKLAVAIVRVSDHQLVWSFKSSNFESIVRLTSWVAYTKVCLFFPSACPCTPVELHLYSNTYLCHSISRYFGCSFTCFPLSCLIVTSFPHLRRAVNEKPN